MRTPPTCSRPVGDGANRVRTGLATGLELSRDRGPGRTPDRLPACCWEPTSRAPAASTRRSAGRTALGCRSLQVFPQSPRVWKPAVHPDENLARFRELAAEADMVAVCHAPYLINLAGTDELMVERSEAALAQALRTARGLAALAVDRAPRLAPRQRLRRRARARRARAPARARAGRRRHLAPAREHGRRGRDDGPARSRSSRS